MGRQGGKTALEKALRALDATRVRSLLAARPDLRAVRFGTGLDLLQFCCSRPTAGNPAAAARQVRLAAWLVEEGFDPQVMHTTAPGEDGEDEPVAVSLVWFAVAKARNDRLARFFLARGVPTGALFAAVWWANAGILADLVRHGDDPNAVVGATPLHFAVELLGRGTDRAPALARRRFETVAEMLRLGADPNVPAVNGQTPLETALRKGLGPAVFRLLLQHGADPDVPGSDGRTVREIAARKRDTRYKRALG